MSESCCMITNEVVESTCSEVGAYSEEQMASEFERFFKMQPQICEFIVELTKDRDQVMQELALFLSYVVVKTAENATAGEFPPVTQTAIDEAFRESENWIDNLSRVENANIEDSLLSSLEAESEPHLLQYVISEINEALDDGTELTDEQKGEVFFVLKTVISTVSRRPFDAKGQ